MDWTLLIDAPLTEQWQLSELTDATVFRLEQDNPPQLGRLLVAQVVAGSNGQQEFLEVQPYPAQAESIRFTLNPLSNTARYIAVKRRYAESLSVNGDWQVRILGSSQPKNLTSVLVAIEPQTAGAIPLSQKGTPSGVATLGTDGKVPASQLPPPAPTTVTPNWTNLSLLNGWLNFGTEYHPASYWIDGRTNEVIFRGTIRAGTTTLIAKNLSIAPSKIQAFSVVSSALPSIGYVVFYPNGDIVASVLGTSSFIYFDGCRYFR